ncbi:enoyl-CoA hydratase/isomerase family protein [Micromonospora humi]|uniref:Carboxymethylproline synthase n=1 Tax=Micromonospora humi TaxID=745366 RepID=A0A1C5IBC2_9ACTN|nr:enoyl-CoA hydratase/isomerase family protein [Micromonospora humi]SCG55544.1 carboxymethylproline synthase [Micromonospora humi]
MTLTEDTRTHFTIDVSAGVAVVEFSEGHRHNMWSMPRMRALTATMRELGDSDVRAVVLFSGAGRSFGVGGDFHETSTFRGGAEVDDWIDHITDLYVACLRVNRPVVAAVDGYAIGIGLQLALTADYRLGSDRSLLKMPEYQLGIACTFGGFMLERSVGRAVMQQMLMSCEEWPAERSLRDHLLHEVAPVRQLREVAVDRARRFADYPTAGFRSTKPFVNAEYVAGLERLRVIGKEAHRAAFAAGEAQRTMRQVIGADR